MPVLKVLPQFVYLSYLQQQRKWGGIVKEILALVVAVVVVKLVKLVVEEVVLEVVIVVVTV